MNQTKNSGGCPGRWPVVFLVVFLLLGSAVAADVASPSPAALLSLKDRPTLGAETAPVTVVEVSSFKCIHCRAFHEEVFPQLRTQYINSGKVRWIVVNASDDPSDKFAMIFNIARCAQRQGKYWEILDDLFRVAHQPPSFLEDAIAQNQQLDRDELALCVRDRAIRAAVADDFAQYAQLKLKGTPSFIVWRIGRDGQRTETVISGAEKLGYFQRVLDEMLKLP